ncbi:gamma-glutamylcyclotransferase family protein [Trinickia sp. Y13]|uniref:gamma-glutamylcyclotransferase family protein n=1 Tax=Trinickia sp. Y13 TaxID=2917807 RepID=UPI002404F34B|nr:gamma-glutamylcyclotransferase family protein [Trinickia sp. Y13]MDG0024068.1 gamma-glutamylcyclotransferase [Trinickia sp. Y13]
MRYVFVYGTLRAGEINDIWQAAARHEIAAPRLIGRSVVSGRLYDFGDYPGLVPDETAGPVSGDVYEIEDALVPVLDRIEGVQPGVDSLFKSRAIDVPVAGRLLPCFFYPVDEPSVQGRIRIEAGDWIAYRLARDAVSSLVYGS